MQALKSRGSKKYASDVDKAFTGVALELSPSNEFKKIDERVKLGLTAFWRKVEGLQLFKKKLCIKLLQGHFFKQLFSGWKMRTCKFVVSLIPKGYIIKS